MRFRLPFCLILPWVMLIPALGDESAPRLEAGELAPDRVPWTRLRFEARKLFLKGTTEITLSTLPSKSLNGQLIESPESIALAPRGAQTSLLELRTSFAGRDSDSRVWFDPHQAFALQRLKRRHGGKAYQKIYRFSRDGVFSHRLAPRDAEESRRPAESWGNVQKTFYRHPDGHRDCRRIADPVVLFYLLSAADLESGEAVRLCAFSDKTLHRVELQPRGRTSLQVDYAIQRPSRSGRAAAPERRRGSVEVLQVAAVAQPFGSTADESFELLGLEGDVELFLIDRIPVQVSGRLPGLGRVNVRLVEVELR